MLKMVKIEQLEHLKYIKLTSKTTCNFNSINVTNLSEGLFLNHKTVLVPKKQVKLKQEKGIMSEIEGGNERENEVPAKENDGVVKENDGLAKESEGPVKENVSPRTPVKEAVSPVTPVTPGKENAESGKKGETKAPMDLSKWLADNKLTNKEKEIKERNLTVEQMADMNENQFKELADGIGLDTLARKRFEKALRQLKPGANNNNNNNAQPVQIVA
ncbi:hypothetical protein RFI_15260, partial [Reticulomyxa filosa]